jgi:hypothetical protein
VAYLPVYKSEAINEPTVQEYKIFVWKNLHIFKNSYIYLSFALLYVKIIQLSMLLINRIFNMMLNIHSHRRVMKWRFKICTPTSRTSNNSDAPSIYKTFSLYAITYTYLVGPWVHSTTIRAASLKTSLELSTFYKHSNSSLVKILMSSYSTSTTTIFQFSSGYLRV